MQSMGGKMRVLSDEERGQIIKEIHQSYKEEVNKMIRLSDEECRKIAQQVHEDFEEVCKKVAQDCAILNRISHEKAVAAAAKERQEKKRLLEQERQEKKLIEEMKPSFFKWLSNLFL